MTQALPPKHSGFARLLPAIRYSCSGLAYAFKTQTAIRQELFMLLLALPFANYFGRTVFEQLLIVGVVLIVLVVELLNTGIEAVVDMVTTEFHPLAKAAKDVGSAAAFVCVLFASLVWLIFLGRWCL